MSTLSIDIINHLHEEDKEKLSYFVDLLLKKSEYENLSKDISKRRSEIKKKNVLSHEDVWKSVNV